MFIGLTEVDFLDVILEGIKALVMFVLIIVLWRAGHKYPQLAGGSWGLIISGFVLMAIGFVFDWTDEFVNYEASQMADTMQSAIEEIGLIGGLVMVTIGFSAWFGFVANFLGLKSGDA